MQNGGWRPGAGRPKGSKTKKKPLEAAVESEAVARGITPAQVLQEALEMYREAKQWDKAIQVAIAFAPYRHPKLNALQVAGPGGGPIEMHHVPDADLDARIEEIEGRILALAGGEGTSSAHLEAPAGTANGSPPE